MSGQDVYGSCPFRKYHPSWVRIVRQNHRIIESDGLDPARAQKARRRWRSRLEAEIVFLRHQLNRDCVDGLIVVPTISFQLLYGLLILKHGRRKILYLSATAHPSAEWICRQLTEAYGWDEGPCYLVRDRDSIYGEVFIRRLRAMGIRDRPTAARSPWQNGYCERLIGSIRRECLDHIVVFGERHLWRLLRAYTDYYNRTRTHLSLNKDSPASRAIEPFGRIRAVPILGGLHHQYVRI